MRATISPPSKTEEIAFAQGFIDRAGMQSCIDAIPKSPYREYLELVIGESN
jgi:hypothetical protein